MNYRNYRVNHCKLKIVFKNNTKVRFTPFISKTAFAKILCYVVYKFQYGLCKKSCYGECERHLNVRIGEHIGIITTN